MHGTYISVDYAESRYHYSAVSNLLTPLNIVQIKVIKIQIIFSICLYEQEGLGLCRLKTLSNLSAISKNGTPIPQLAAICQQFFSVFHTYMHSFFILLSNDVQIANF